MSQEVTQENEDEFEREEVVLVSLKTDKTRIVYRHEVGRYLTEGGRNLGT